MGLDYWGYKFSNGGSFVPHLVAGLYLNMSENFVIDTKARYLYSTSSTFRYEYEPDPDNFLKPTYKYKLEGGSRIEASVGLHYFQFLNVLRANF